MKVPTAKGFELDRLTRKELKTDRFALEVGHGVEYVSEHRGDVVRYGAIAAGIVLLVLAIYGVLSYRTGVREDALNQALQIQDATVAQPGSEVQSAFPTQEAKDAALKKALTDVASKYSGTEQGAVARYYLGTMAADKGDLASAESALREVVQHGNKNYASMAKLALAPVLQAENKGPEGEKLLRSVVDHPTTFVSKEEAIIALARYLAPSNAAEARKLLEPLRTGRSTISRAALSVLSELPR
jgi:predicted negative regulator of RcsB-dependent stress response